MTTADGAEREGRTAQLGRSRGVRIGPGAAQDHYRYEHHDQISCFSSSGMARAALQLVAREIMITTGAGSDGTWKM